MEFNQTDMIGKQTFDFFVTASDILVVKITIENYTSGFWTQFLSAPL